MLGEIFYWIFNMSIAATICMVPVLLLRLIKKIPRRIFIWLWLVPFIRMCIPVGISSKYSIMALLSKFTTKTVTLIEIGNDSALTMMNHVMGANSYFPIIYKGNLLDDLFNIASVVWLIVALAAILTLTIIYFITLGEMKDAQKLKDNIYISDKVKTPAVYGIIKPKIILPTEYDANKLNFILMHEKAHIKRKDKRILRNKKHVAILRIANNNESDKRIDEVKHYSMQDLNDAKAFFGTGFTEHIRFEYTQSFDEARYINDLLSSATAPLPNEANFDEYVSRCKNVFYKYFGNGHAELPFAVNCYIGRLDT